MTAMTPILLKNPQNGCAPNSRICAATLDIGADYALKAQRTVTGREGSSPIWPELTKRPSDTHKGTN